jgi:protein-tyrosine phosphatase
MTLEHRSAVLEQGPRQLHRTFTLTEAARLVSEFGAQDVKDLAGLRPQLRQDEAVDIPDPIGQDPEFFTRVAMLIAELLEPVMELCRHSSTN